MPLRRYRKRSGRRRVFRRSFRKYSRRTSYGKKRAVNRKTRWTLRSKTIIPDYLITKQKFTHFLHLLHAGGTTTGQNYYGNAIYKPKNGSGDSAFGITEYSTMYQNYTVFASSIKATVANNIGDDLVIIINPDSSVGSYTPAAITNLNNLSGLPFGKFKMITAVANAFAGGVYGTRTMKHYMPTQKIEGISRRRVIDDDVYQAATTSIPSKTWSWWIMANCVDMTSAYDVNIIVEITYYVKYFMRQDFATA